MILIVNRLGIGLHVLLVPAGLYSERSVGPAKSIALLSILVANGCADNWKCCSNWMSVKNMKMYLFAEVRCCPLWVSWEWQHLLPLKKKSFATHCSANPPCSSHSGRNYALSFQGGEWQNICEINESVLHCQLLQLNKSLAFYSISTAKLP